MATGCRAASSSQALSGCQELAMLVPRAATQAVLLPTQSKGALAEDSPHCGRWSVLPERAGRAKLEVFSLRAFELRNGPSKRMSNAVSNESSTLKVEKAQSKETKIQGSIFRRPRQLLCPQYWLKMPLLVHYALD